MAGVIQLGDAIKFAELAWTVWEYGWAREHNAGQFAVSLYCQPSPKPVPVCGNDGRVQTSRPEG
jgi:hypothetical protein